MKPHIRKQGEATWSCGLRYGAAFVALTPILAYQQWLNLGVRWMPSSFIASRDILTYQQLMNESLSAKVQMLDELSRLGPELPKAKPVSAWRRAYWRVRRFVKSIFYVACSECGTEMPRFWPSGE